MQDIKCAVEQALDLHRGDVDTLVNGSTVGTVAHERAWARFWGTPCHYESRHSAETEKDVMTVRGMVMATALEWVVAHAADTSRVRAVVKALWTVVGTGSEDSGVLMQLYLAVPYCQAMVRDSVVLVSRHPLGEGEPVELAALPVEERARFMDTARVLAMARLWASVLRPLCAVLDAGDMHTRAQVQSLFAAVDEVDMGVARAIMHGVTTFSCLAWCTGDAVCTMEWSAVLRDAVRVHTALTRPLVLLAPRRGVPAVGAVKAFSSRDWMVFLLRSVVGAAPCFGVDKVVVPGSHPHGRGRGRGHGHKKALCASADVELGAEHDLRASALCKTCTRYKRAVAVPVAAMDTPEAWVRLLRTIYQVPVNTLFRGNGDLFPRPDPAFCRIAHSFVVAVQQLVLTNATTDLHTAALRAPAVGPEEPEKPKSVPVLKKRKRRVIDDSDDDAGESSDSGCGSVGVGACGDVDAPCPSSVASPVASPVALPASAVPGAVFMCADVGSVPPRSGTKPTSRPTGAGSGGAARAARAAPAPVPVSSADMVPRTCIPLSVSAVGRYAGQLRFQPSAQASVPPRQGPVAAPRPAIGAVRGRADGHEPARPRGGRGRIPCMVEVDGTPAQGLFYIDTATRTVLHGDDVMNAGDELPVFGDPDPEHSSVWGLGDSCEWPFGGSDLLFGDHWQSLDTFTVGSGFARGLLLPPGCATDTSPPTV